MSHYKQQRRSNQRHLWQSVSAAPLLLVTLSVSALSLPTVAHAKPLRVSPSTTTQTNRNDTQVRNDTHVYKVHFKARPTNADIKSRETRLDWRSPQKALRFDVPESHWVESLELMVAGTPDKNTDKHLPVFVTLNKSKIIPLNPYGQAFDARLQLSPRDLRLRRNEITFSIPKPAGYECLAPHHGGWDLNLDESFLVVKARRRLRDYQISDIKTILAHPDFAPRSVSIVATGPNRVALESLTAQAVALKTPELPDFKAPEQPADLKVIVATRQTLKRAQFSALVTDDDILLGNGPKVVLHSGAEARLIITADTETDLEQIVKAFGTYDLPAARRKFVSLGEFTLQTDLSHSKVVLSEKSNLKALETVTFADNWEAQAPTLTFDVKDRLASVAKLSLPLTRTADISPDSFITVALNGREISRTRLDKNRTDVTAQFNYDHLKPFGNTLTMTPFLISANSEACGYQSDVPGLFLGKSARLDLVESRKTPLTELSRFSSNGAPFSLGQGQNTVVAASATSETDRLAALKIMGHLAKVSGSAWINADYVNLSESTQQPLRTDKHILVIGPKTKSLAPLIAGAPKNIVNSWAGQESGLGLNVKQASLDRIAQKGPSPLFRTAARQYNAGGDNKMQGGGLIGLYASRENKGRLNGVISVVTGDSFALAADSLVNLSNWNALTGSVARWNRSEVLMVQLAKLTPDIIASNTVTPSVVKSRSWSRLADFEIAESWDALTNTLSTQLKDLKQDFALRFERTPQSLPAVTPNDHVTVVPPIKGVTSSPQAGLRPQLTLQDLWGKRHEQAEDLGTASVNSVKEVVSQNAPYTALKRGYESGTQSLKSFEMADLSLPKIEMPSVELPDLSKAFEKKPKVPNYKFQRAWQDTRGNLEKMASEFSLEREFQALSRKVDTRIQGLKKDTSFQLPPQAQKQFQSWESAVAKRPGLSALLGFILVFILLGLASPMGRRSRR